MRDHRDTSGIACRRCGTCCEKGGPSLHLEDRHLVERGLLPAESLITFRKGEWVRDNVRGTLSPLSEEIIKIKGGAPRRWTCHHYDPVQRGCRIYADRPLECRSLNCRDTRRIESIYATTRLTRRDLLATVKGLWELIVDHEARCSHVRVKALVDEGTEETRFKAEAAILEMLRYDHHLRQLTVEKGGTAPGMLDFLFGRPLSATIDMHGIRLMQDGGVLRLLPTSPPGGGETLRPKADVLRRRS